MKEFLPLLALYTIIWTVFAFYELPQDDNIFKAYIADKLRDSEKQAGSPRLRPLAPKFYKLKENEVVSRVGEFMITYKNCTIFDRYNWSCVRRHTASKFGARQGIFFDEGPTPIETLSRFEYVLLQCKWDLRGGSIMCLIRPFII